MRTNEVLKLLRISASTLRLWERQGILKATTRDDFNYRIYDEAEIKKLKARLPTKRGKGFSLLKDEKR